MHSLPKLRSGGWIFIDNVGDQIKFDDEMTNAVKDWDGLEASGVHPSGGTHPTTLWFQKP